MSDRVSKLLNSDLGLAIIRTFVARGIAALGSLALALVIGRLYGPEGMGVYALGYSLLLGAGILARRGADLALMRYVGQVPDSPAVLRYLRWAVSSSLLFSLIAMILLLLVRRWLEGAFEAEGLAEMLVGIALAVPAFTFAFLLSGFFKGVRMSATACLLGNGSVALAAAIPLLYFQYAGSATSIGAVGYSYAVAAWLVALQGAVQLWFWYRKQSWSKDVEFKAVQKKDFDASSMAFFTINLSGFMQSVLSIMVAGWLLESAELGLFKSAQQMALLISFILIVINAIFPPRFAALCHQGNMKELGKLARLGSLLGLILAAPILLVCLLFPAWVLAWFGEGFSDGSSLLRVIACAQLFNVMTGSVGYLLSMTGYERLFRNITLLADALGLIAFCILIPFLGALGAAYALAFVLAAKNMVALFYVWRKLGVWTLPGPNLLKLMGVKSFFAT